MLRKSWQCVRLQGVRSYKPRRYPYFKSYLAYKVQVALLRRPVNRNNATIKGSEYLKPRGTEYGRIKYTDPFITDRNLLCPNLLVRGGQQMVQENEYAFHLAGV